MYPRPSAQVNHAARRADSRVDVQGGGPIGLDVDEHMTGRRLALPHDLELMLACRQALVFFKVEAGKMQVATDLLLKEESFDKIKKNFDSKSSSI